MTPTLLTRTLAALGAAALLVSLASCGDSDEKAAENLAEELAGGDVDIDVDGENVTIEGEDGDTSYSSSNELPDDFPDSVALVDGTLMNSTKVEADGTTNWSVIVGSDSDSEQSGADAIALLVEAGFTEVSNSTFSDENGAIVSAMYEDDTLSVMVGAVTDDSGDYASVVTYVVTTK